MALMKYLCTHCGRRFEAEKAEILECPGCFWSTSVRPDEGAVSGAAAQESKSISAFPRSNAEGSKKDPFTLPGILRILGIFIAVIAAVWLLPRGLQFMRETEFLRKPGQAKTDLAAPESVKASGADAQGGAGQGVPSVFTPEDEAVLSRRVEADPEAQPTGDQLAVLSRPAAFQSGSMQKLPSKGWSVQSYDQMITQQERAFKLPFPRSYRKKLIKLFETNYPAGTAAFEAGDLLAARNAWVASLEFPLYSQNPMRHKSVALTMLRPFINDTLSKIGALNTMIVEAQLRSREEEISRDYQAVRSRLEKESWKEADEASAALLEKIRGFENSVTPDSSAPPYPEVVRRIDSDISVTLMDLLTPPTPPIGNLVPISEDLRAKRAVLATLQQDRRQEQQKLYDEGLALIQAGSFAEAEKKLMQVRFPDDLAQDARAKTDVLRKRNQQTLDSSGETS